MQGRLNQFQQFRQNNFNNTGGSLSSSRIAGNFNQGPQRENLGTYRVPSYRVDDGPSAKAKDYFANWKEYTPNSIITKDQALHLSITELRVEDYFMIRTNRLESKQARSLENCIKSQCFNQQLLNSTCYNLFPFSRDRPLDLDALKKDQSNNSNNSSSSFNNSLNNVGSLSNSSNQTSNGFGRNNNSQTNNQASSNQTSGNIFNRNGSNNSSGSNGNPFLGNNTNGNVNDSSARGGKIFNGQQTTNTSSNNTNIFGGNNANTSNNGNKTNGTNNIFSSNAANGNNSMNSSNNTNNAFNNFGGGVNSNNTNHSNAQQQGNNGNQNAGNFTQNNNNSNPFNQNTNNASKNTSNSQLFANNSNNLNHLFGNNQQNGNQAQGATSNNIFNTQNSSFSNQNQNSLAQNQQTQQNNQANMSLFSNNSNFNPNMGQPFNSMDMLNGNTLQFLNTQALFFNGIMKEIQQRVIQKVSPFEEQRRQSFYGFNSIRQQQLYSRQSQAYQQPFFSIPLSKNRQDQQAIIVSVVAQKKQQEVPQKSQIYPQHFHSKKNQQSNLKQSNLLPIQSRISNRQDDCFKSIKLDQISQTKKCKSILFQNAQSGPKECSVRLEVKWMDKMKEKPSQGMKLVRQHIRLPHLDISSQQGLELLVVSLKEIFPIIRNDAKIIINHNQSNFNSSQILLVGSIEQFFINLDPKEYQASFNSIKSGHIHNLTIIKFKNGSKTATISWDAPINYEELDFSVHAFNLQLSEVICDVQALNSRCRITFEALPQRISKIFNSTGKSAAAASLKSFIQGKNQEQKLFEFCSLYDDGSWTFLVQKFN